MRHIRPDCLKLVFTAGMLLWTSIAVTPATAAPVAFNFTGKLYEASDALTVLNSPFNGTETVSGSFTYNDAAGNFSAQCTVCARYSNAVTSLIVNIASGDRYTATLGTAGVNQILLASFGQFGETYSLRAPLTGPVLPTSDSFGNLVYHPLYFQFDMHDNRPFPSLALEPPSLSNVAAPPIFRIVFENDGGPARLVGTLSSLTAVPLPPAVILFGAGLVALSGLVVRSRRPERFSVLPLTGHLSN